MPMSAPAPRVSVICIFYDAKRFFVDAIESVLGQDFQDFELLLVDDGSSDGSTAIAVGYAQRQPDRIIYLEHDGHANRGMSATRNLGLAHARGDLVAFIDSDDHWQSGKLREQVDIMDIYPELGCVAGTVNYWKSWNGGEDRLVKTGHVRDRVVSPPEAALALYPLGFANAPTPSDLMLRSGMVERLGGFEAHFIGPLQLYEDQGFLAKLYLEAPVYFSSRQWLDYRQHDGSCVFAVTREGRYREVREYFLAWYEAYLRTTGRSGDPRLRKALRRAWRTTRHPRATAVLRQMRHAAGRVRRLARLT